MAGNKLIACSPRWNLAPRHDRTYDAAVPPDVAIGDDFGSCGCGGRLVLIGKTLAGMDQVIQLDRYNVRQKVGVPAQLRVGKCTRCRAEYAEGFRPEDRAGG